MSEDFESKKPFHGLQPDEMTVIMFKLLVTWLKREHPAVYDQLVDWWATQK